MTITNDFLLLQKHHPLGGVQRLYRFANGAGLSVVNAEMLHSYPFAWEIAVVKGFNDDGEHTGLDYSTPLTTDVEVFMNDEDANAFIARAASLFEPVSS